MSMLQKKHTYIMQINLIFPALQVPIINSLSSKILPHFKISMCFNKLQLLQKQISMG